MPSEPDATPGPSNEPTIEPTTPGPTGGYGPPGDQGAASAGQGYPPPGGYGPGGAGPGSSGGPEGAGGYPPPGPGGPGGPVGPGGPGYGPGGYGQPAYPYGSASEDRTWALIAHFGGAAGAFFGGGVLGWIAPLIALLARGNQSPVARAHAAAALNFQLLWTIVGAVGWALTCILIGFIGVLAAVIIGTVFGVIAGVKAANGEPYRYPMTVNWVK